MKAEYGNRERHPMTFVRRIIVERANRQMWREFTSAAILMLVTAPGLAQSVSGSLGIHDPSTIVKDNSKYFVYGDGQGITAKLSSDHEAWTDVRSVFPINSPPSWTTTAVPGFAGYFWAPDVAYFNDLYHMYYAASTFGSKISAIGLATSPTLDSSSPSYHWSDQGAVIQSNNGTPYNAIDPSIIQTPEGRILMSFGSYSNGIYMTELSPTTGLRITPTSTTTRIANTSDHQIEASYVFKHDNYYYQFVDWGGCCAGVNSTYNLRVGRSTTVTGPYFDQAGVNMVNGGGTLFLGTEGKYIGPGHIGIINDGGVDWFSYHYYDGTANGAAKLNVRTMSWTSDGWPVAGPSFLTPGDVNLDGIVDANDFNVISDHLFQTANGRASGDLNNDGIVNYDDFRLWKANYGGAGSVSLDGAVPEPASGRLFMLGLLSCFVYWQVSLRRRSTRTS
jgi:arabinan endo-1,5-alpha-L-arabinosidase